MKSDEMIISNYKADGSIGGGTAFSIVGDHDNRPTDMTNLIVIENVHSIDMGGGKSQCIVLKELSPTLTCTHYGEPAVCYEREDNTDREEVL